MQYYFNFWETMMRKVALASEHFTELWPSGGWRCISMILTLFPAQVWSNQTKRCSSTRGMKVPRILEAWNFCRIKQYAYTNMTQTSQTSFFFRPMWLWLFDCFGCFCITHPSFKLWRCPHTALEASVLHVCLVRIFGQNILRLALGISARSCSTRSLVISVKSFRSCSNW